MNVAHLVETLEDKHVELSVTAKGKLRIVSNKDFIHSSTFRQLKDHKAQVVSHLNHEQAERLVCSLKLHDDREFVRQQLTGVNGTSRLKIVRAYFNQWHLGANSVSVSHWKGNAGRRRANIWLRERNNAKP